MARKNARKKRKCQGKISYKNIKDAIHALDLHVVKYQPARRVSAYRCVFCKKFHIGHSGPVRVK